MLSVLSSLERCRHTRKQIMTAQQEEPEARMEWLGWACLGCRGGHHPSSQQDSGAWSCRRLHWRMDAGMRASLWECSLWHSAGGTGTVWGPSTGREVLMLMEWACHLGHFVCKTLFIPRWMFFHCCFPLMNIFSHLQPAFTSYLSQN